MYFESLIQNLSLVFARNASFCLKYNFSSSKILKSKFTFSSVFNFTIFFAFNWVKSFVTEEKKLVKLWWWNFSIFHCISDMENVVFRQNEGFLVKTKHRFGFRDQKHIIWVRGSSPDVGSLEFGCFLVDFKYQAISWKNCCKRLLILINMC